MQALFILGVWTSLAVLGCLAPFVLALAYIWVDLFRPHDVAPTLGQLFPLSLVTALLALGTYVLVDRRDPPRLGLLTAILVIWAGWITLTTTWAHFPAEAWIKWDWAFKTILFTAFLPFFFRSRIQIEAALLVILCCIASNVVPFAIKSILAGGGYGRPLGLIQINAGWGGEGSTLGTYAFACLPLVAFLQRHSLIAPARGWFRWVYLSAPGIAVVGALGTFARAALVACVVWAALVWWQSRRKLMVAIMLVAGAAAVVPLMGDAWMSRISTSFAPRQDESANTRILVWEWTIGLANRYPAGAGFNAYLGNRIEMQDESGQDFVQEGRAFHSIYFEVLGEHGWIGLAIFLATFGVFFLDMRRVRRAVRGNSELEWLGDLARALSHGILIFMVAASFVGIAFYPLHYYLLAIAVSTSAALHRAALTLPERAPQAVAGAAVERHAVKLPAWRERAGQTKPYELR